MKRMIKLTSLLLAVAMMLSLMLTGCGPKQAGTVGEDGKLRDEQGRIIIRVSIPEGSISEQAVALMNRFMEKNPNIVFKPEPIVGDYTTKLITQASAGTAPDLIWVSDINTRLLASKGLLTDVSAYYERYGFNASDVYETMLQAGQYEGIQYMVPRDFNQVVTYYNKELFDKRGVDYPKDGWTWQDFLDTAYQLTEKKGSVYTQRACQAFLNWGATAPLILVGLGGTLTDPFPSGTAANFNTAGTVNALKTIDKLCDDGIFVNDYYNDIGGFGSGKVAMAFQTRSSCSSYCESVGVENVGVTTFPILPEQHIVGSGCSGYAVMNNSKCKEEAAAFLFYVVSEEGQKVFMETGDCVPVLKSLANDETWRNSIPGIPAEPFLAYPEACVLQPCITVASDSASLKFDSAWKNAFSSVLSNINDAEKAAEIGQKEFERAFAED